MSMQASTIRILERANFTPPQALALAEAIETEINGAQLVTVPIMDSRFAHVEMRFAQVDSRFAQVETRFAEMKLLISEVEKRLFYKMIVLGLTMAGIIISCGFLKK